MGFILIEVLIAILIIASSVSTLFLTFKQYVNEKRKTYNFEYSIPTEIINKILLEQKPSGQIKLNNQICYYKSNKEKIGNLSFDIENKKKIELIKYNITCGKKLKFVFFRIKVNDSL